jgi:hypothetical protein
MSYVKLLLVDVAIVFVLYVGIFQIPNTAISNSLFFLLFPGNAVSLKIAGGHGGTKTADSAALVLGPLVNVACYFMLSVAVKVLAGRFRPSRVRSQVL